MEGEGKKEREKEDIDQNSTRGAKMADNDASKITITGTDYTWFLV